jgi:uncharacterized membrane protein
MKELDLSNASVLKWILSFKYYKKEIEDISDICSLTRKTLAALVELIICTYIVVIVGGIVLITAAIILSPLTLFLPTTLYAPLDMITMGVISICIIGIISTINVVGNTLVGNVPILPSYIKVKTKVKSTKPSKVKETSKTMLAVKEMYKSLKDKTCIKVKL